MHTTIKSGVLKSMSATQQRHDIRIAKELLAAIVFEYSWYGSGQLFHQNCNPKSSKD
jgi:hypothetical protein